ncbi:MAG TPA: hypothetical protein VGR37_10250 [Longimicrobiaceae bacterium]|nr:hypothetical protein [Longimicrobiaceae bacterium]
MRSNPVSPSQASDVLAAFGVHPRYGFLPATDPVRRLPDAFSPWEALADELSEQLIAGTVRRAVRRLPRLDPAPLAAPGDLARAMLLLSYFGHAYVWGDREPVDRLPANLAVPWHAVAERLDRPPVLSYASQALTNWRRLDAEGPVALGNIALLEHFFGGVDEAWFIQVHIDIEGRAGPAMQAIVEAQEAAARDDAGGLERCLGTIAGVLSQMLATLSRMGEQCDPYIFYTRIRPFVFAWKDNPALPHGLRYDGVAAYGGRPQAFRGSSGAQSSIVPSIHAALGVSYASDPLQEHMLALREYMPPGHRAFITHVERGPSIRAYVQRHGRASPLVSMYDACLEGLYDFQAKHLEYAALFVHAQSPRGAGNPVETGTGGTPFMRYLKKRRDELVGYAVSPDGASRGCPLRSGLSAQMTAEDTSTGARPPAPLHGGACTDAI